MAHTHRWVSRRRRFLAFVVIFLLLAIAALNVHHRAISMAPRPHRLTTAPRSIDVWPPTPSPQHLPVKTPITTFPPTDADFTGVPVAQRTCRDQFGDTASVYKNIVINNRYTAKPLPRTLRDQLVRLRNRVLSRRMQNARLWDQYIPAIVNETFCLATYRECGLFDRADLPMDTHDAKDGWAFLLRKCCIEHHYMLRALRSLYVGLAALTGEHGRVDAWLTAGTLLGVVREQGAFVPWDTDVDVLIQSKDEARVRNMLLAHRVAGPKHATGTLKPTLPPLRVDPTDGADGAEHFAAWVPPEVREHAHGRMIGAVFGTEQFRHEEASRVEIWVAQETRKMQQASVNLPLQRCRVYRTDAFCPADPIAVLERGYGPHWCVPCKSKSQNCKAEMAALLRSPAAT